MGVGAGKPSGAARTTIHGIARPRDLESPGPVEETQRFAPSVESPGPVNARDRIAERIAELIRIATGSDAVVDLSTAAWSDLRRPLAVFDRAGLPLARNPSGRLGREAVAAGLAAAQGGERPQEPWLVEALWAGSTRVGCLAIRDEPALTDVDREVLDALRSLLAGQLHRAELAATVVAERARAVGYRLITDPGFAAAEGASEARAAGIELAGRYWPAILFWDGGVLPEATMRGIEDLARRQAPESLIVGTDGRSIVVLLADTAASSEGRAVPAVLADIVRLARRRLPGRHVRGITGEASVPTAELPAQVRSLERLRRSQRDGEPLAVAGARRFALNRLFFEGLDRAPAREFVRGQIGTAIAYDKAHGTDLVETLEVALDHPNRDEAAGIAHMHRNTFRRHLNQALELVGVDLHDPDERLALHVALRLRRLCESGQQAPGDIGRGPLSGGEREGR